jgi:hypothetical protein
MPHRVTLARARGWRLPPNTKKVDRTTQYGNPFRVFKLPAGSHRLMFKLPAGSHPPYLVDWNNSRGKPPAGFETIACETELDAHEQAVRLFRDWLTHPDQAAVLNRVRRYLVGLDLACWCPLDLPCHADVLLEVANR